MLFRSNIQCIQLSSTILARQHIEEAFRSTRKAHKGFAAICTNNMKRSFPDVLISVHAPLPQVHCCLSPVLQTLVSYIILCTVCIVYELTATAYILFTHFSRPLPHCVYCMHCPSLPSVAMLMNKQNGNPVSVLLALNTIAFTTIDNTQSHVWCSNIYYNMQ